MKKVLAIIVTASSLLSTVLQAQELDRKQFEASLKANEVKLPTYTYKERITISMNGQLKGTKLYEVRYDLDGQKQQILLTPTRTRPKERGLRGRIIESKLEKTKDYLVDLACISHA
jgi:hypothetical protein